METPRQEHSGLCIKNSQTTKTLFCPRHGGWGLGLETEMARDADGGARGRQPRAGAGRDRRRLHQRVSPVFYQSRKCLCAVGFYQSSDLEPAEAPGGHPRPPYHWRGRTRGRRRLGSRPVCASAPCPAPWPSLPLAHRNRVSVGWWMWASFHDLPTLGFLLYLELFSGALSKKLLFPSCI